jgi:hypothetical protein
VARLARREKAEHVTEARFPGVALDKGHYESFYLRAVDPERPRGVWIRHTTHQRPGRPPTGSVWCTYSEAAAGAPYAVKETHDAPRADPQGWIQIGNSRFGPAGAEGHAWGQGRSARWDLAMHGDAEPLRHLPRELMYRAPLPRTKLESPLPSATFDGTIAVDDRPHVTVTGWRGMAGHNWGSEHAATWIWLHGIAFEGEPGAWLDLSVGRVRVGRLLTPWIANGAIQAGGERRRLGGPRPARVHATPEGCRVELPGAVVEASAPGGQMVAWPYADPGGGVHHSLNCSIAELTIRLRHRELHTAHGGVYEQGVAPGDHDVELQPFPDG